MYPNLTPTLTVLLGIAAGTVLFMAIRRPFLRRLALRQVSRRRTEAALVIAGSMLGTAIIVGSLIVGDTLDFSVKDTAYTNLGPLDEIVMSPTPAQGGVALSRLRPLEADPMVDGLMLVHGDPAAITIGQGSDLRAEPRATVWEMNLAEASTFGGSASGISGPTPAPHQVVLNEDLARSLGASVGDTVTLYLYGQPVPEKVVRIIPTQGLAGFSLGSVANDAFVGSYTLASAADAAGTAPRSFVFISNTGDVEGGNRYSDAVADEASRLLGPLTTIGTSVQTPKQDVLNAAKTAGDNLGSMFLFIGSFAIIAGVMLLVVIFAMLAEERKAELGMLRAIGMKRSRLIRSFVIEGAVYAFIASAIGIVVGLGVGRAVVIVAARIFNRMPPGEGGLSLAFHVSRTTLINGFAMGFLIAFLTVVATSIRISRINIIAAIRDLPTEAARPIPRRWVVVSTILAAVSAALAVPSIVDARPVGTYLFPSLAIMLLCPLLVRFASARGVYTGAALAVLGWTLAANIVRPAILDSASTAAYVILGVLLTFSAVFLVSLNQNVVTAPLRPVVERSTPGGLATRLGLAYPVARRFRTGSILVMYGLVVFTLVLMVVLAAMINSTVTTEAANAAGGFTVRVDFNPSSPIADPAATFTSGPFAGQVQAVAPLVIARASIENLGTYTRPIDAVLVGVDSSVVDEGMFPLLKRMPEFPDDRSAWEAVLAGDPYVIVDQYLGSAGGGPQGTAFYPGDTLTLTGQGTEPVHKTIAGVLKSATGFYGAGNTGTLSPVIESSRAAQADLGKAAQLSAAFLKLSPSVSAATVASRFEARFLSNGLAATVIRRAVDWSMAATNGFFQLMEGFLVLGLLVGIAGLGVMMVRAVRERRRSIGVLRALGFPAKTVRRSFLTESSFVAFEGILIGTVLALVTSYLLYANFPSFQGGTGFPIPFAAIAVVILTAAAASVLVTLWPARRAARVRPAVALRME